MADSYTKTAVILHWLMAVCMIVMLAVGLVMGEDDILSPDARYAAYQFHKSLGLTFLLLTFVRIGWRLTHKAPSLPQGMTRIEIILSKLVHMAFYGLMVILPLTGWAIVSSSPRGFPTMWFGLFQWPHIPFLTHIENKEEFSDMTEEIHETLAWICIVLIVLHAAAAMKHHLVNRDAVLTRMLPFLRQKQGK